MKINGTGERFSASIMAEQGLDTKEWNLEKGRDSLVARLKTGQCSAASELVDLYHNQIFLFFRRMGHNYSASQDLTQQTFIKAWKNIKRLRNTKSLNAWLFAIAANLSRKQWRRYRFKPKMMVIINVNCLPDSREANSDPVELADDLNELKAAVSRLPVKLRQAVVLHYMQHLSIQEAATAASVRAGTFKSRLSRALKALRKELSDAIGE